MSTAACPALLCCPNHPRYPMLTRPPTHHTPCRARDLKIAKHVMQVHFTYKEGGILAGLMDGVTSGAGAGATTGAGDIDIATMKKFITFARNKCAPRLSEEAGRELAGRYADIREQHSRRQAESLAGAGPGAGKDASAVIPITTRQLEALIRITESVAKAGLRATAGPTDVQEALRLFKVSTLTAAQAGLGIEEGANPDTAAKIRAAEARIRKLCREGDSMPLSRLKERLQQGGYEESEINAAIRTMEVREELRLVNERKTVQMMRA